MPFTLVHPAAVVPLARGPLVVSALVAGAIAPDVLYLWPLNRLALELSGDFNATLTHSFPAVLWVGPLLTLAMLLAWYAVLRRPLLSLAPPSFAGRFAAPPSPRAWVSPRFLFWVLLSAAIGATTHVVWDAVTHGDLTVLRSTEVAGMRVNRILQYISTVAGAAYLAWWVRRWWRRTTPGAVPDGLSGGARRAAFAVLAVAAVAGAVVDLLTVGLPGLELTGEIEYPVRAVLAGASAGIAIGLAAYVIAWHGAGLLRRARAGEPASR
ncbi:hypothetical protein BAY61_11820 [Prauserella marina]|uniref:Uncharacterized protein n=1 Tax=Prauserella marina TaxID=530584 RepID=A0A222VNY6_9PSEU|nr:DUF4184 family protein [Prauserella marina]ASR35572.1 hypothetical protein BAY61_11820 [Prauserella marina]PWV84580.1 uncharacterized protein DUF4184 [Prauserella marina]SDC18645.1 protein of unknown function [Prauserella marina]